MTAFKNINLSEYFKRYGLRFGVKRLLFTANPVHIVHDYNNKKLLYYYVIKRKLKKWVEKNNIEEPNLKFNSVFENENIIWIYWKQGLENAPALVKKCVNSVKKNTKAQVIILSDANLKKYIELPSFIIKKNKAGDLSNATLADLIRISLLEHYGGTWIDATVLLTGTLPKYVTESDFFAFQDSCGMLSNPAKYSNWLLHCKKNNVAMKEIRNIAFQYWRKENYVMEYLWMYIITNIVLEHHSEVEVPYANSDYSYLLLNELDKSVNKNRINHITSLTSVHKLTYKLTDQVIDEQNNVYHYILNSEL